MSFSDGINKFVSQAKKKIEDSEKEAESRSKEILKRILGDDYSKIKSITLNSDTGKFEDIDAPDDVIAKIRSEGY